MSESLRRSIFYAMISGAIGTVNSTITTGAAWTGFIRGLGLDAFALGIITAIPVAANAVQILASYFIEKTGKRRELFIWVGLIGRMMWMLCGFIPLFIPLSALAMRTATLALLVMACSCANAVISVGYFSLVTDLVPMRMRGSFFGTRSAISLLVAVLTGLGISMLLDRAAGFTGYVIALTLAGIFGALDIACYLRVDWPQMKRVSDTGEKPPSFGKIVLTVWRDKPFRTIMLMLTYWGFAVNISAPFVNMYMLEVVGMTYTQITLINQVLPNVIGILVIKWWGRRMDEFGNKPVMNLTGMYMALYPLLWIFAGPGIMWMIMLLNVFTGLSTNAYDISVQNLYLNAAPEKGRSMYISVHLACTQLLGYATSSALGGWLLQNVFPKLADLNLTFAGFRLTRYHFMFMTSFVLRTFMLVFLVPRLKEAGSQPMTTLVKQSSREIKLGTARRFSMIRANIRRRRARRVIDKMNNEK
jgi:MFS family permease